MFCYFYPGLDVVQASAPPAPPHTPSAASDSAAPTQKAPTAPANNVVPPFTAAVQSDTTTSTDPAPAAVQSKAGVSFSLPDQHDGEMIRDSPKRESHKKKSEENKMNTRAVLERQAKSKRQGRLDKMRKKAENAENAERMAAAEQKMQQEMRARQNEAEHSFLDDLILEAQKDMEMDLDLGIEDID